MSLHCQSEKVFSEFGPESEIPIWSQVAPRFSVAMVADCLFWIGVADIRRSIFKFSFNPSAFADDLDCTTRILVVNGVSVFSHVPSSKPMPAGRANWKRCASKSGEGLFEQNTISHQQANANSFTSATLGTQVPDTGESFGKKHVGNLANLPSNRKFEADKAANPRIQHW